MSDMHDQDDLPPKKDKPHQATLSVMLGEVAGSAVWIAIIFAIAAVLAWLAIKWMS